MSLNHTKTASLIFSGEIHQVAYDPPPPLPPSDADQITNYVSSSVHPEIKNTLSSRP